MKKTTEFTGPLATPIKPRRTTFGMLLDPNVATAEFQRRFCEDREKLLLLADYFGTPRDDFYALSLALARQFVKGFKERTTRGTPTKWTELNRSMLVVEMERLIVPGNKSKGAAWAAEVLAKRNPWKSFIRKNEGNQQTPDPGEVLRTTYMKSKRLRFVAMARKAYKFDVETGCPDDWDALVRDCLKHPVRSFDDQLK